MFQPNMGCKKGKYQCCRNAFEQQSTAVESQYSIDRKLNLNEIEQHRQTNKHEKQRNENRIWK